MNTLILFCYFIFPFSFAEEPTSSCAHYLFQDLHPNTQTTPFLNRLEKDLIRRFTKGKTWLLKRPYGVTPEHYINSKLQAAFDADFSEPIILELETIDKTKLKVTITAMRPRNYSAKIELLDNFSALDSDHF